MCVYAHVCLMSAKTEERNQQKSPLQNVFPDLTPEPWSPEKNLERAN